jgi:hypothetical protein
MEDAVHGRLDDVPRVLLADHHVAQLPGAGHGAGFVDRKGENIGGLVEVAMLPVQLPDPGLGDELNGEMSLAHAGGPERCRGGRPEVDRHVRQVEHVAQSRGRVSCSYSP